MKILGISAYYHDAAAALIIDGQVAAAAQEERFTRKKHDSSFPHHAVRACLEATGTRASEIDFVTNRVESYGTLYSRPAGNDCLACCMNFTSSIAVKLYFLSIIPSEIGD